MDDHLMQEPRIRRGRRPRAPDAWTPEPRGPHRPGEEAAAGPATLPQPRHATEKAATQD